MSLLALSLAAMSAASVLSAKEKHVMKDVVASVAYKVFPHQSDYSFTLPGREDSSCYTVGNWYSATTSCRTYVTPPTDINLHFQSWEVVNQVIYNGDLVTLYCVAHRQAGNCRWFVPGNYFGVSFNGNKVDVEIMEGKWATYKVVTREPLPTSSGKVVTDTWCFKNIVDVVHLFEKVKAEGQAAARVDALAILKDGRAQPMISGDGAAVGASLGEFTWILPNEGRGACYIATPAIARTSN